jgi:hypothetical protein
MLTRGGSIEAQLSTGGGSLETDLRHSIQERRQEGRYVLTKIAV